jgi:hypothetical protein
MLYSSLVIDWFSVFINSFWIVGLAILLAAFSYHYWLAAEENRRLKEQLAQPGFQKFYWFSFVLIAVGLAGTSQKSWEIAIWIIFALISVVNMVQAR